MSDTSAIIRDFFLLKREALDQSVEAFRALHAIAPVALVEPVNLYVVTGYDALKEVTLRTDDFSSRAVSGEKGALRPALLSADPPVHSRHKRLAGRAFSPTALRPREDRAARAPSHRLWRPVRGRVGVHAPRGLSASSHRPCRRHFEPQACEANDRRDGVGAGQHRGSHSWAGSRLTSHDDMNTFDAKIENHCVVPANP